MFQHIRHLDFEHWNRDKRVLLEVKLPSRIKFGTHALGTLAAWTEGLSRHLAVVHSRESVADADAIQKDDAIALEIDVPEKHPFSPRHILCEGHVGFVSRLVDDRIRLGMIVDRMHFRASDSPTSDARAQAARCGRRVQ
jgi:hypothetical protein